MSQAVRVPLACIALWLSLPAMKSMARVVYTKKDTEFFVHELDVFPELRHRTGDDENTAQSNSLSDRLHLGIFGITESQWCLVRRSNRNGHRHRVTTTRRFGLETLQFDKRRFGSNMCLNWKNLGPFV
jgi:hypothetical protein